MGKNWTTNFETLIEVNENRAGVLCTDGHVENFNKLDDLIIAALKEYIPTDEWDY